MSEAIHLDEHLRQRLADVAIEEQVSIDDVLRRAVEDYLDRHQRDEVLQAARFERLVNRLMERVPTDVPDAEIDADIDAAITEVRQARRAARRP